MDFSVFSRITQIARTFHILHMHQLIPIEASGKWKSVCLAYAFLRNQGDNIQTLERSRVYIYIFGGRCGGLALEIEKEWEKMSGRGRILLPLALQVASEYYRLQRKPPVTAALLAANTVIYLRPAFLRSILPSIDEVWFNPHLILKVFSQSLSLY